MRNFSILLVAAVGLFSNLAVADQTITRTYSDAPAWIEVQASKVRDPVYSSVMNLVQSATGAAGAAWSSIINYDGPTPTDAQGSSAYHARYSSLFTLLPTPYQSYIGSINSKLSAITATWVVSTYTTTIVIPGPPTTAALTPIATWTRTYYEAPEAVSIGNSQLQDPAYSSVLDLLESATGVEGAAWTSILSAVLPLSTAGESQIASAFSEVDRLLTLLPTAYQSHQKSIKSQLDSIRATWIASTWTTTITVLNYQQTTPIPTPSGSAPETLSIVKPSTTIILAAGSSLLSSISAASVAATSKAAATSTAGAENLMVMGYAVAMGAVGAAAVLL